jgi:hypothetical protein
MKITSLMTLLLLASQAGITGEKFPAIKQLMTEQEFISAGLNKQSLEELEALNARLIRYTALDAQHLSKTKEVRKENDKVISCRIEGKFWVGMATPIFT